MCVSPPPPLPSLLSAATFSNGNNNKRGRERVCTWLLYYDSREKNIRVKASREAHREK